MQRAKDGSGYGPGRGGPGHRSGGGGEEGRDRVADPLDRHRLGPLAAHRASTRYADGVAEDPGGGAVESGRRPAQRTCCVAASRCACSSTWTSGWTGATKTAYNVIGEIRGREKPDEVVVIGGHLDSWDLGTGAIDDGAGVRHHHGRRSDDRQARAGRRAARFG